MQKVNQVKKLNEEDKNKIVNILTKSLQHEGSILRVANTLQIPYYAIRPLLLSTFHCRSLYSLRRKLKIKRKMSDKQLDKLKTAKKYYDKYLTLQKTADKLNISRERVRQLLNIGQNCGLFKYEINAEIRQKRKLQRRNTIIKKLISKYDRESLINEIKMLIDSTKICGKLNITTEELKSLLNHFNINYGDYREATKMGLCLEKYMKIVDILGHHPTTTEMMANKDWRNIRIKIHKYWGSFDNFRKEYGIEKPNRKMWLANSHKMQLYIQRVKEEAKLRRESEINSIIEILKNGSVLSRKEIGHGLNITSTILARDLSVMLKSGIIRKIGNTRNIKYIIN